MLLDWLVVRDIRVHLFWWFLRSQSFLKTSAVKHLWSPKIFWCSGHCGHWDNVLMLINDFTLGSINSFLFLILICIIYISSPENTSYTWIMHWQTAVVNWVRSTRCFICLVSFLLQWSKVQSWFCSSCRSCSGPGQCAEVWARRLVWESDRGLDDSACLVWCLPAAQGPEGNWLKLPQMCWF